MVQGFGFGALSAVAMAQSLVGELRAYKPAMQCDKAAAATNTGGNVRKKKEECGQSAEVFDLERGHFPLQGCKLTAWAAWVIIHL